MKYQGNLHKMHCRHEEPVVYELELSGELLRLNDWLGGKIAIEFLHQIECIHCGRKIKKKFQPGLLLSLF